MSARRISRLFVYPIKSCAGVEVAEAVLTEAGLDLDRAWMVVDEKGEFVSQRELPRMALVRPQLKHYEVVLRAPGMLALHLNIEGVEAPVRVRVWDDEVAAFDMGDVAAQWFSDFLGAKLRLVRFDPEHRAPVEHEVDAGRGGAQPVQRRLPAAGGERGFAGRTQPAAGRGRPRRRWAWSAFARTSCWPASTPTMKTGWTSSASPLREEVQLRPVKPCPRCPIPNIDPATAQATPEVSDTLQAYRRNEIVGGAVTFGMNAIVQKGADQTLRVGQAVTADWRFD